MTRKRARLGHLARRFFAMLWPKGPGDSDEAWVRTTLGPGELELWGGMSRPDRRHAAGVARRAQHQLGDSATRPVLAAALLHDVGKVEARLGAFGRAAATVAAGLGARSRADSWCSRRGIRGRFGRYLVHDRIGAELLADAGSDPLTVAWAAEHHLESSQWSLPAKLAHGLKEADDD